MAIPQDLRYINNVVSTTNVEVRPDLVDNTFNSNALLAKLYSKNKVVVKGGDQIWQNFIYGRMPGGSYAGTGPFVASKTEFMTPLRFDWKMNYKSFTLPGIDVFKNAGPHRMVDLVAANLKNCQLSIADEIGTQLFSDGSNVKDITGLVAAIGNASNTYGGIARSTSDPIGSKIIPIVDATGASFSQSFINSLMGRASRGGAAKVDLIITTQTLWDSLWARVQPAQRISGGSDHDYVTKIGFDAIYVNGALVCPDSHCPDGYAFGINTDYVEFVIGDGKDFAIRGPFEMPQEDSFTCQLILYSELVVSAPNLCWTASGLIA